MRLLADMENLRDRTTRQAEQARSFAIQVHLHIPCRLTVKPISSMFAFVAIQLCAAEMPPYWPQGFVKSLLDVADNLERAAGSVTDESLKGLSSDGKPLTAKQSSKLLNALMEGVQLTDRILLQAGSPTECIGKIQCIAFTNKSVIVEAGLEAKWGGEVLTIRPEV